MIKAYLPVLIWAGLIFTLSSQPVLPSLELSAMDFIMKKVGHMFLYAMLYILLVRAWEMTSSPAQRQKKWFIPLLLCLLYALSDELHQSLTGGSRSPSLRDVGYDLLGASLPWLKQYRYV
jgi:VanZ family protein